MKHHHHYFHFLLSRKISETKALYSVIFLKTLAVSLISIFIPVYLYLQGYNLSQMAIFFLIYSITAFIFVYVAGKSVKRIGIKKSILIANFLHILGYLALAFIPQANYLFYVAAVILGAFLTLFWVPFHVDMADNLKRKDIAGGVGTMNIVVSLVAALAPFTGALIASVSFFTLFIISSVLILISSIPLFFAKGIKERDSFSIKETLSYVNYKRVTAGIGFGGEHLIAGIFWPLFLYLILNLKGLGLVTTIMLIASAIFVFFIAKIVKKAGVNRILRPATIVNVIHWPLRLIKSLAIPLHVIYAFIEDLTKYPYNIKSYMVGKQGKEINAIALREFLIQIGRAIACIPMIFFPSFTMAFICATIFAGIQFFYSFEKYRNMN